MWRGSKVTITKQIEKSFTTSTNYTKKKHVLPKQIASTEIWISSRNTVIIAAAVSVTHTEYHHGTIIQTKRAC